MNRLYIDTRDNKKVIARINTKDNSFEEQSDSQNRRPESILILIDKVCARAKITIHDVDEIEVEEGPGSYTGLKVGASVANALSFALQKKVNGKPFTNLVEPKYE